MTTNMNNTVANRAEFEDAFVELTLLAKKFTAKFAHCTNQDEMNAWAEELTEDLYGEENTNHERDNAEGPNESGQAVNNDLEETQGGLQS